ncbi:MAG: rhodanese-like domain-containing protein [Hyphomicrobiales bacterium]|nr:rhodanese-like domain-containing protein [Hyphomicrobiales bacterium]
MPGSDAKTRILRENAPPAAYAGPSAYAGDVSPREAWRALEEDEAAQLVDVRTRAELAFVGSADLSSLNRSPLNLPLQEWPDMAKDKDFAKKLAALGVAKTAKVFFICRSGQRSRAAAITATAAGFSRAYNVAHGFEGELNAHHHRRTCNGWQHDGLPWRQT